MDWDRDHVNDHVNDQVEPISRAFQKLAFSLRNDRPFTCGQEVETKRNQISCSRGQTNFHLALICHVSILIFLYQRTGEYGKASLMTDLRLCGPWDRSFRPR